MIRREGLGGLERRGGKSESEHRRDRGRESYGVVKKAGGGAGCARSRTRFRPPPQLEAIAGRRQSVVNHALRRVYRQETLGECIWCARWGLREGLSTPSGGVRDRE